MKKVIINENQKGSLFRTENRRFAPIVRSTFCWRIKVLRNASS